MRTIDELKGLADEGKLDKKVVNETLTKGLGDLYRSSFSAIASAKTPAELRSAYGGINRIFGFVFGSNNAVTLALSNALEKKSFDSSAKKLLDSNMLTAKHPAAIMPMMYDDTNNIDNFTGTLFDIATRGVQDKIVLNEEGLILDGQQRFRCSVLSARFDYPTRVDKNWTDEDTFSTIERRHLTKSQKVAIAHLLGVLAGGTQQERSDRIGVARSTVAQFDSARKKMAENGLPVAEAIEALRTGVWDITRFNNAGNAISKAKVIAACLKRAGAELPVLDSNSLSFQELPDWKNYVPSLDTVVKSLSPEQIKQLKDMTKFPDSLLPQPDVKAENAFESAFMASFTSSTGNAVIQVLADTEEEVVHAVEADIGDLQELAGIRPIKISLRDEPVETPEEKVDLV